MFNYIDSDKDDLITLDEWKKLPQLILHAKKIAQVELFKTKRDEEIETR